MKRSLFPATCFRRSLWWVFLSFVSCGLVAGPLDGVDQLVVAIAPDWNSSQGQLRLYNRENGKWQASSPVFPALFGKSGLAWGRGVVGQQEPGMHKVERDRRAPAGIFKIGKIYTYDEALPGNSDYPHHTVGPLDAWVDDPTLPEYNRFLTVDPQALPSWFEKQRMRHGDFAYRWLVEIRHNSDPPAANAGSAIFFHIRRGPTRPTSGCTTLEEKNLVTLIRWLRAGENPHYALLTKADYLEKWQAWSLPPPALAPL